MDNKTKIRETARAQATDVKDYLFRVMSNWKWFLLSIPFALAVAYIYNLQAPKIYGLTTTIAVKEKSNPLFASGTNIAFNWGGVSDKVESIRKSLGSRSHNEKVVREMQFYIEYLKDGQFRLEDIYGEVPFKLELQPNQMQILNQLIQVEVLNESSFKLSVDFSEAENLSLINYKDGKRKSYTPTENFERKYDFGEYINLPFLKGQIIRNDLELSDNNRSSFIKLRTVNAVTQAFRKVSAKGLPGTSLVEISITGTNKNKLVDYLNKTVQVLADDELAKKTNYARSTRAFIDDQFKNTADSLRVIEQDIMEFKEDNDIYNLSTQGSQIFERTTGLDEIQVQLRDRIAYLENLEEYIQTHSDYSKIPAPAIINIEDGSISSMVGELTELSIQQKVLVNEVTENHPSLILLNQQLETTRDVLLENIASLKQAIQVNLSNSYQRYNVYNQDLTKLPAKEQQLVNFERKYRLTESNFVFLMQKRYEADIAIAASVSDISVLDTAKDTGQDYVLPRVSFNYMIALLLGILLPLMVIILKEVLDNRIYTVDELERLSSIPLLGVVGRSKMKNRLVVQTRPESNVAESFRALRTNVQFMFTRESAGRSKTIMISSSVSGEGKTFVSMNLATVFALGGKKVVIVGMDLRKPKLYEDFDLKNDVGVVNYLVGKAELSDIINKTEVENLDVILSGPIPPNPSELLLNKGTDALFDQLKEQYDIVIIDTPPLGLVSDAMELVQYADASIFVVRQAYTQKLMLKTINEKYNKNEIEHVSMVFNDFKVSRGYGYNYGYGRYANNYLEAGNRPWYRKMFRKTT